MSVVAECFIAFLQALLRVPGSHVARVAHQHAGEVGGVSALCVWCVCVWTSGLMTFKFSTNMSVEC